MPAKRKFIRRTQLKPTKRTGAHRESSPPPSTPLSSSPPIIPINTSIPVAPSLSIPASSSSETGVNIEPNTTPPSPVITVSEPPPISISEPFQSPQSPQSPQSSQSPQPSLNTTSVQELAAIPVAPVEMSNIPGNDNASESERPPKKLWVLVILGVLIGVVVAGFAIFNIFSEKKPLSQDAKPNITSTITPTSTLVPSTPTPKLNKGNVSIEVLNGSGIAGLAAKAKTYLESLGYTNVKAGNAGKYNYQQTEISIKASKSQYTQLIISDLQKNYELKDSVATLSADYSFDVSIVLGQQ